MICYHVLNPVTHTHTQTQIKPNQPIKQTKQPLAWLLLELCWCNLEMMGWIGKANQNPNLTLLPYAWTPIELGYESHWCLYSFAVSSVWSRSDQIRMSFRLAFLHWPLSQVSPHTRLRATGEEAPPSALKCMSRCWVWSGSLTLLWHSLWRARLTALCNEKN